MQKKQRIALLLVLMMIVQYIPIQLFANPQAQVKESWVVDNKVRHTIDPVTGVMRPDLGILWNAPTPVPGESTDTDISNVNGTHPTLFYQIEMDKNITGQIIRSEPINVIDPTYTDNGIRYMADLDKLRYGYDIYGENPTGMAALENGVLYKLQVVAKHLHETREIDGKPRDVLAPADGTPKDLYFVTDFDTRVEVTDEGLQVSWEYIPGMNYDLTYVEGNKATVGEVNNGMQVTLDISADEALGLENNGRVEYVFDTLKPQRAYSFYVQVGGYNRPLTGDIEYNKATDISGPKVVSEITPIDIRVTPVGGGMVEVYWGDINGMEDEKNKIVSIQILAKTEGGPNQFTVVAQTNDNLSAQEAMTIEEPKANTTYKVRFNFSDGTSKESREYFYELDVMTIPPHTPQIPKPFGPYVDRTDAKVDPKDYLVKGDDRTWKDETGEEVAELLEDFTEQTFHGKKQLQTEIQLVWNAPKQPEDDTMVDYDLVYDIWVVDNSDAFKLAPEAVPKVVDSLGISEVEATKHITHHMNTQEVIGMKWPIKEYVDYATKTLQPLKKNQTYYIKVVAKRQVQGTDHYIESTPAIVAITIDKEGNIFPPPVIGKPPLQIKEDSITTESMVVEWRTNWWEVVARDLKDYSKCTAAEQILAEIGSSRVYAPDINNVPDTTTGPAIRYVFQEDYMMHELFIEDQVKGLQDDVNSYLNTKHQTEGRDYFSEDYYTKYVELVDDVAYEMDVLPYSEFEQLMQGSGKTTIEEWMQDIAPDDTKSGLTWTGITPDASDKTNWIEYPITETAPGQPLKPNTRYIMLLRAYRMVDGEKLVQSFPTYVIATTLTDFVGPEPIPTVPDLFLDKGSVEDTQFDVYWHYNKDFRYEVRYSTKDDPETAKTWEFTVVESAEEEDRENGKYFFINGQDAYLTLNGLFPETTYNVWIKAHQKQGSLSSGWSTPVTATTDSLDAPEVPGGLGPASKLSLEEAGDDGEVTGEDFITVEWTKDPNDKAKESLGTLTKWYEYDLEFADNIEFIDSTVFTVTDDLGAQGDAEFIAKNIIRIKELLPNRPYYVRVKARIVMEDSELDKMISAESDYSKWVRIMTRKTDDEYDGGENDNIVTYPDKVEESYENGIWEWEIKDAQGVITDIITSEQYVYEVEMDLYGGRYDARVRRVIMPTPVVQALIGQKMELRVVTHAGEYRIPAHALAYKIERAHAEDELVLEFETKLAYDLQAFAKPYPYVVENGEALRVFLRSKSAANGEMIYFDAPIDVALKLDTANSYQRNTYKTYTYDYGRGDWVEGSHAVQVREDATYLSYRADKTGIYTLYRVDTHHAFDDINYAIQQMLAQYNIIGLGVEYKVDDIVDGNAFMNLMLGLAEGKRDINLNGYISDEDREKARITKIYMPEDPAYITEEQAINGMIRLYEMKNGYRVEQSNRTFGNVSPMYRESVAKAYTLGLITEIDPARLVSYGQLCEWLLMVLPG